MTYCAECKSVEACECNAPRIAEMTAVVHGVGGMSVGIPQR
jgi:hypothetical protein